MDFLIENDDHLIRNIHEADRFISDSFEAISLGMSVTLIVGRPNDPNLISELINPNKKMVQGVKFLKPDWNLEDALDWLSDNQKNFKNYTEVKKFAARLKSIKGVEIFSAGTWNGDKFTEGDLDLMVSAFNETSSHVRPFIKLGHSAKQALLEAEGLPAAGWVGKVYRSGSKLMADFVDIPRKIHELIVNKAYRKVSSEIFLGLTIDEKKYKYLVGAVALLGAETPGVMNLSDILSRFGLRDCESIKSYAIKDKSVKVKQYSFENEMPLEGIMQKTEREIELETLYNQEKLKNEASEKEAKKFKLDAKSNDDALKAEIQKREDAEKKSFAFEQKAKDTELEAQADKLVSEKIITKAGRQFALAILKDEPESKKYSLDSEGKKVELTKFELIKKFAQSISVIDKVNLGEGSIDGKSGSVSEFSVEDVEKYAVENKLEFSAAYVQMNEGKLSNKPTGDVED